jgi:formylglycine-generating enzyme required for sulfatase activity
MGCEPARGRQCPPDEQPVHAVTIDALDLMAAETSVNLFRQHAAAAGLSVPTQPVWSTSDELPVVGVAWQDAVRFCGALGGRLPTEAEWEYATRGGHRGSLYPWGDTQDRRRANGGFPWRDGHDFPVNATTFPPNDFGLFNTVGNVWEWVNDWYDEGYYAQSEAANPPGPPAGTRHLIRGGSFHTPPEFLRITKRGTDALDPTYQETGFRCARGQRP